MCPDINILLEIDGEEPRVKVMALGTKAQSDITAADNIIDLEVFKLTSPHTHVARQGFIQNAFVLVGTGKGQSGGIQ